MNSKNLSKAINRMLAFLLSVAMIATSSFVTPALADVIDDEVIEVVNEIGSEAASDTVMTTDDSTDIIVENLEEGGEEASDIYDPATPKGSEDISTKIQVAAVVTDTAGKELVAKTVDGVDCFYKVFDGTGIELGTNNTTLRTQFYIDDATAVEMVELDFACYKSKTNDAAGLDITSGDDARDSITISGESAVIGTAASHGAGWYRLEAKVKNKSSNTTYVDAYEGSSYIDVFIDRADVSSILGKDITIASLNSSATSGIGISGTTFSYRYYNEGTSAAPNFVKGQVDKADFKTFAVKSDGSSSEDTAVQALHTLFYKGVNNDNANATLTVDNTVAAYTTDAKVKITEELVKGSGGDKALSEKTPVEYDNSAADKQSPKVVLTVDQRDFTGKITVPFTIASDNTYGTAGGDSALTIDNTPDTITEPVNIPATPGQIRNTIPLKELVGDESGKGFLEIEKITAVGDDETTAEYKTGVIKIELNRAGNGADYILSDSFSAKTTQKIKVEFKNHSHANTVKVISIVFDPSDSVDSDVAFSYKKTGATEAAQYDKFTYGDTISIDVTVTNPATSKNVDFTDAANSGSGSPNKAQITGGQFYKLRDKKDATEADVWDMIDATADFAAFNENNNKTDTVAATVTTAKEANVKAVGKYKLVATYTGPVKVTRSGSDVTVMVTKNIETTFEIVAKADGAIAITAAIPYGSGNKGLTYRPGVIKPSKAQVEFTAGGEDVAETDFSIGNPVNATGIWVRADKESEATAAGTTLPTVKKTVNGSETTVKAWYYGESGASWAEEDLYVGEPYVEVTIDKGSYAGTKFLVAYDITKGVAVPVTAKQAVDKMKKVGESQEADISQLFNIKDEKGNLINGSDGSTPVTVQPTSYTKGAVSGSISAADWSVAVSGETAKITFKTNSATLATAGFTVIPDDAFKALYTVSDPTITVSFKNEITCSVVNGTPYTYSGAAQGPSLKWYESGVAKDDSTGLCTASPTYWRKAKELGYTDAQLATFTASTAAAGIKACFEKFDGDADWYTNKEYSSTDPSAAGAITNIAAGTYYVKWAITGITSSNHYFETAKQPKPAKFVIDKYSIQAADVKWHDYSSTAYTAKEYYTEFTDEYATTTAPGNTDFVTDVKNGSVDPVYGAGAAATDELKVTIDIDLASGPSTAEATKGYYGVIVTVAENPAYTGNKNVSLATPIKKTFANVVKPYDVNEERGYSNEKKEGSVCVKQLYFPYDGKIKTPELKDYQFYKASGTSSVLDTANAFAFSTKTAAQELKFKSVPSDMYKVTYKNNSDASTDTSSDITTREKRAALGADVKAKLAEVKVEFSGLYKGTLYDYFRIGAASAKNIKIKSETIDAYNKGTSLVHVLPTTVSYTEGTSTEVKTADVTYGTKNPLTAADILSDDTADLLTSAGIATNGELTYNVKSTAAVGKEIVIQIPVTIKNYETTTMEVKLVVKSAANLASITFTTNTAARTGVEYNKLSALNRESASKVIDTLRVTKPDGTTLFTADEIAQYIGYKWSKKIGTTWTEVTEPETANAGEYRVEAYLKGGFDAEPVMDVFTITKYDLKNHVANLDVTLNADSFVYSAALPDVKAKAATVTFTKAGGTTYTDDLTYGKDFELIAGGKNVNATETVSLKANATGEDGSNYCVSGDTVVTGTTIAITAKPLVIKFNGSKRIDIKNAIPKEFTDVAGTNTVKAVAEYLGIVAEGAVGDDVINAINGMKVSIDGASETTVKLTDKGDPGEIKTIFAANPAEKTYVFSITGVTMDGGTGSGDVTANYSPITCTDTAMIKIVNTDEDNDGDSTAISDEVVEYYVSFIIGGEEVANQFVMAGKTVDVPVIAEEVAGWFTKPDFSAKSQWNFAKNVVNKDIVVGDTLTLYGNEVKAPVTEDQVIIDADIMVEEILDQPYTGKKITPAVAVRMGDRVLKKGTDYTVTYPKSPIDANKAIGGAYYGADRYIATVTFKKDYKDLGIYLKGKTIPVEYAIVPRVITTNDIITPSPVSANKAEVSVKPISSIKVGGVTAKVGQNKDFTWCIKDDLGNLVDNKASREKLESVKLNAGTLTGKTYTVEVTASGKNFVTAGPNVTKNIVLIGKGKILSNAKLNLNGDKTLEYQGYGAPALPNRITVTVEGQNYDYYPKSNTWDDKAIAAGIDTNLEVVISPIEASRVGTVNVVLQAKTGAYAGSKKITYKVKGFKIKAMLADVKNVITKSKAIAYDGHGYTFNEVYERAYGLTYESVGVDNDKLKNALQGMVYGTDYYINYKNNIDAGTATMTFIGGPASPYAGTKYSISFKIQKPDIKKEIVKDAEYPTQVVDLGANVAAAGLGGLQYNGSAVHDAKFTKSTIPADAGILVNTLTDENLVYGVDYSITYKNNKITDRTGAIQGSATAVIKGKGNYAGSFDVTFDPNNLILN